ncbi:flagellar protein FlaG [Paenibacillus agri]|uniref:flagellar protein FlaG n=1 Tax=Paenibacillus agri TaxID=2744309 RepID=UPI001FE30145|nr:flagellar protein FlaG [Paenibacillus agri]
MSKIIPNNTSAAIPGNVISSKSGNEKENSSMLSEANIETAGLPVEREQLIQQLEKAIRAVQGPEKSFEISIHEQTHAIMVKVFDKQSGDLIREIPPEKLLDVAANMMELSGLIVDEKI